jgi:hypothetical protein
MVKLSRVLGLAVAFLVVAVVANSVFAAEGDAPKKGKGKFDPAQIWAGIVKAAEKPEGTDSLTADEFKKGFTASGRKGATAERAQAILDKAAVDGKITKDAYLKYLSENMGKRGKKGGGEKKADDKKAE